MRLIQIVAVAVVAGAVRHAIEGPIPVREDEEAERLVALGLAEFADEVADGDEGDDEDLDAMQVPDLKKLAADEGVDLGSATKKADIIAAINAHRAGAGE